MEDVKVNIKDIIELLNQIVDKHGYVDVHRVEVSEVWHSFEIRFYEKSDNGLDKLIEYKVDLNKTKKIR